MSQDFDGKIWTSELNSRPEVLPPFDRTRPVRFFRPLLAKGGYAGQPSAALELAGEIHSPQQALKTGIGTQGIPYRTDFQSPPEFGKQFLVVGLL